MVSVPLFPIPYVEMDEIRSMYTVQPQDDDSARKRKRAKIDLMNRLNHFDCYKDAKSSTLTIEGKNALFEDTVQKLFPTPLGSWKPAIEAVEETLFAESGVEGQPISFLVHKSLAGLKGREAYSGPKLPTALPDVKFGFHDSGYGPETIRHNVEDSQAIQEYVTAGSYIDPAGRRKLGEPHVVLDPNLAQGQMYTLPYEILQAFGFGNCLQKIDVQYTPNQMKIQLTTTEGKVLTTVRDDNHLGSGPAAKFFEGNPQKNNWFNQHGQKVDPPTREQAFWYILCKELGDTLQVLYAKPIAGPSANVPENMKHCMFTIDKVVAARCVAMKLGVLYKEPSKKEFGDLGKALYYPPPSNPLDAKRMEMTRMFEKIRNHNANILEELKWFLIPGIDVLIGGIERPMNELSKQYIQSIVTDITSVNASLQTQYATILQSQTLLDIDAFMKTIELGTAFPIHGGPVNPTTLKIIKAQRLFPSGVFEAMDTILRHKALRHGDGSDQQLRYFLHAKDKDKDSPSAVAARVRQTRLAQRPRRQQGGSCSNLPEESEDSSDPTNRFFQNVTTILHAFMTSMLSGPNDQTRYIFQNHGVTPDDFVFFWLSHCYDVDDIQNPVVLQDFLETVAYSLYSTHRVYLDHIGYTCLNEAVLTHLLMECVVGKEYSSFDSFADMFRSLSPVRKELECELQTFRDCEQEFHTLTPRMEPDTPAKLSRIFHAKQALYTRAMAQHQETIGEVQARVKQTYDLYLELSQTFPSFQEFGYLNGSVQGIVHMIQSLMKIDREYNHGNVAGEIVIGDIASLSQLKDKLLRSHSVLTTPLGSTGCASGFCVAPLRSLPAGIPARGGMKSKSKKASNVDMRTNTRRAPTLSRLLRTLSDASKTDSEQYDAISSILYKHIYELQSEGGPLYLSVNDVPDSELRSIPAALRKTLNQALQKMNELHEDGEEDIGELFEEVFSEDMEGGAKKTRKAKAKASRRKKSNTRKRRAD